MAGSQTPLQYMLPRQFYGCIYAAFHAKERVSLQEIQISVLNHISALFPSCLHLGCSITSPSPRLTTDCVASLYRMRFTLIKYQALSGRTLRSVYPRGGCQYMLSYLYCGLFAMPFSGYLLVILCGFQRT
jgi:hypothetical protein